MKVLKGLVLTMLVSTATIFAMDASEEGVLLITDGLASSQIAAKTTGFDTVTEGQTSVVALSSREVAAISLKRLITAGGIDENTSFVLSKALSTLGKVANTTEDTITALTGLTTGGGVSVETYARVQSVVDVLNSEIEGVHTWMQTPNGMLTDRAETGVSSEGIVVGTTLFSLTANEVNRIELSRLVADLATKLNGLNIFTLSATTEQLTRVMGNVADTDDALSSLVGFASELVDSDADTGDVVDLSLSVMQSDIGTSGLQRQSSLPAGVAEESNTAEVGF